MRGDTLSLLAHGGTPGLVAEILVAVSVAGVLGLVWVKERRRTRAHGRRPAGMRDDVDQPDE